MITYNHEKYIHEAIEGVLNQELTIPLELIIANDSSSDNTDEVVNRYILHHPKGNLIKYVKHPKNIGMQPNFVFAYEQCSGDYIALCEGDDYWNDPKKLQKQIDYLKSNPNCTICCHDVEMKYENVDKIYPFQSINNKQVLNFEDVFNSHFIPTLSIVFPKRILPQLPVWFTNVIVGDIPLTLLLTSKGYGYYFFEKMGVKRKNPGGVTQNSNWKKNDRRSQIYTIYQLTMSFVDKKYKYLFGPKLAGFERSFAKDFFLQRNVLMFIKYISLSLYHDPKYPLYLLKKYFNKYT